MDLSVLFIKLSYVSHLAISEVFLLRPDITLSLPFCDTFGKSLWVPHWGYPILKRILNFLLIVQTKKLHTFIFPSKMQWSNIRIAKRDQPDGLKLWNICYALMLINLLLHFHENFTFPFEIQLYEQGLHSCCHQFILNLRMNDYFWEWIPTWTSSKSSTSLVGCKVRNKGEYILWCFWECWTSFIIIKII